MTGSGLLRRLLTGLVLIAALGSPATRAAGRPQTLIVVGLDGFRPDYLDAARVPTLRRLAGRGVRGDGLIPPFPSKTFPSFLTIATGLRPVRHGIVNNTMYDPAVPGRFTLSDHAGRSDPRWWLGEPIWNTAERQGVRAAGMFWPGDDVEILGRRPSDWRIYADDFPNEPRVDLVLEWLSRPERERPRLVMLYFSLVDTASHNHGPHSPEALAAAAGADALLARLVRGLATRGLEATTNLVVVSDHGMAETSPARVIVLDDYLDLSAVDLIETGPSVRLRPKDDATLTSEARRAWTDRTLAALRGRHPRMAVYRGAELPARFHYTGSVRIPPIIGLADDGWLIQTRAQRERWLAQGGHVRGEHGFDPAAPSMRGLFVAAGPAIAGRPRMAAFESRHLYPFFCRVLGIQPGPNDGDPRVLARVTR
jgi:predicted AlkP superfamily pyrophosphatase or phosphodiesterase